MDLPLREMLAALRNARRRLLHGMSGNVLNALHNATAGSDALHEQVVIVVFCEAVLCGYRPANAVVTPMQQWEAVRSWAATLGSSAASSLLGRCIERIERDALAG